MEERGAEREVTKSKGTLAELFRFFFNVHLCVNACACVLLGARKFLKSLSVWVLDVTAHKQSAKKQFPRC
jgi:type IV secretory pathway TrbD component